MGSKYLLRKCLEWVWRVQIPSEDVFGVLEKYHEKARSNRPRLLGAIRAPHEALLLPEAQICSSRPPQLSSTKLPWMLPQYFQGLFIDRTHLASIGRPLSV